MLDLKKKVEALLFSSGKSMTIEEIAALCKSNSEEIKQTLNELKKEYDEKDSSLMFIEEGENWKLSVREQYLPIVQKIVTETELSKTVIETLAVIAFKYPILQSDLIKVRTNKAYDHLSELENAGYISRQKHGRTKLIKLTGKFFEYFDLPKDKIKEKFKDFESIAKIIEDKEDEIEKIKEEQRKESEDDKKEEDMDEKSNLKEDEKLETYERNKDEVEEEEKPKVVLAGEKLGNLKVVDEPSEEKLVEERDRLEKIKEKDKERIEKEGQENSEMEDKDLLSIKEKEVDNRVEEILHHDKENGGVNKENQEQDKLEETQKEEMQDLQSKEKEKKSTNPNESNETPEKGDK